tara:strand:+ start:10298 stop:10816 length:519 start_codon:yes stop_codon:yes gene_type:complete
MKLLFTLLMISLLFSCAEAQLDDLEKFVADSKSKIYPLNDDIPTLKKIDTLTYNQVEARSPFSKPQAEVATEVKNASQSCPQPDFERKKQALEMYALSSMKMRGTLSINGVLWALVQVSGSEVYRVRTGYYLGLNYGKVLKVSSTQIDLLELASDRNGCWKERVTQLKLLTE